MTLTSIINKNKNFLNMEDCILSNLKDGTIFFKYKGYILQATDDFKVIDISQKDFNKADENILNQSAKFLLKIKLENGLEEKTEKRKVNKI